MNPKRGGRDKRLLEKEGVKAGCVFEIVVQGGLCIEAPAVVDEEFVSSAEAD